MRLLLFLLATCAGIVWIGTHAEAQNYPWCALYGGRGGGQNCGFTTFQQCQAALSGGADFCQPNTQYVPPPGPHSSTRVQRRYRY